jgi:hypothetical protein
VKTIFLIRSLFYLGCRFVNVKLDGKMGTVLLENPAGFPLFSSAEEMQRKIGAIYSTSKKLSSDEKKMQPVKFESRGYTGRLSIYFDSPETIFGGLNNSVTFVLSQLLCTWAYLRLRQSVNNKVFDGLPICMQCLQELF